MRTIRSSSGEAGARLVCRLLGAVLACGGALACGKKGPPLAPFQRVPAQVSGLAAQRIGDVAYLSFEVPEANADGRAPADLERLEVYAITAVKPPETIEQRKLATLIATLPVRPVLPALAAADGVSTPSASSLLPGYDQGAEGVLREPLTPEMQVPVEFPPPKDAPPPPPVIEVAPPVGPLLAPPPMDLGRRFYFVVGVSPRGRSGAPSAVASVPFGATSSAPGAPDITLTATELTLTWTPPPDARTASLARVRPAVVAKPAAPSPGTADRPPAASLAGAAPLVPAAPVKAASPPPRPLLGARSLGFDTQATTYHVYEALPDAAPVGDAAPDPLTPQPLVETTYTIKGLTYGANRCFFVRAVDRVSGVAVQGPASPVRCVALIDTFPPGPPKNLAAIGGAGVINLIWEPNNEADLAGYVVLRGEAPNGTLQPLMTAPIIETTYADSTVQPGVRYLYAVVAVDKAEAPNTSPPSNQVEESAR